MASTQRSLSQTDSDFLARMEGDTDARRKTKYINELKKHPSFKPSMLGVAERDPLGGRIRPRG